jgi:hypothetical protein
MGAYFTWMYVWGFSLVPHIINMIFLLVCNFFWKVSVFYSSGFLVLVSSRVMVCDYTIVIVSCLAYLPVGFPLEHGVQSGLSLDVE